MKRWSILLLGLTLTLMLVGCASFRKKGETTRTEILAPSARMTQSPSPSEEPDFSTLSFLEMNNLYLQLLEEKQAAGGDTEKADDIYLKSLEASLAGESALADRYLQEAILLLGY